MEREHIAGQTETSTKEAGLLAREEALDSGRVGREKFMKDSGQMEKLVVMAKCLGLMVSIFFSDC
jgi:hypothetical protein